MIHRRLLVDDWRGVGEPLNETEKNGTIGLTQRMKHYLVFSNVSDTRDRKLQYILDTASINVLANNSLPEFLRTPLENETSLNLNTFPMQQGLKVYLRDLGDGDYLLRLMNNDLNENKVFRSSFDSEELSLNAIMTKEEMETKKLKWFHEELPKRSAAAPPIVSLDVSNNGTIYQIGILLFYKSFGFYQYNFLEVKPLEIKTFKINIPSSV